MRDLLHIVAAGCFALGAASATGQTLDVTDKVIAAVKSNALSIKASNAIFTDPAVSKPKKLKVEYRAGETTETAVVIENDTLVVRPPAGRRLVILKATYGVMNDPASPVVDVTDTLSEAIKNRRTLSIVAEDRALRRHRVTKDARKLAVEYTVGGEARNVTVNERETLKLPRPGDGDGELKIIKATWGAF